MTTRRTFLLGISFGALAVLAETARAAETADRALEELIQKFQTLKDKAERLGVNLAQLESQQSDQKSAGKRNQKKLDQSAEYKKKLDQAISDYRDLADQVNPLIDRIADTWKNHSDKFNSQEYQADIQSINEKYRQLVRAYNAVKTGNMQRGELLDWVPVLGDLIKAIRDWLNGTSEKEERKNKELIDRLLACKIRQYEMLPT
jgi:chromosome segregation ATPase